MPASHMVRAEAALKAMAPRLHAWLEVLDARAPDATCIVRLRHLLERPRITVLTHADLADETVTRRWCKALGEALVVDGRTGAGVANLKRRLRAFEPARSRPITLALVGVPNVGKSSLINRLAGERKAPTGAKPGLTRAPQRVRPGSFEIIDLPGLLPGKVSPLLVALGLATPDAGDAGEALAAIHDRLPRSGLAERYGERAGDAETAADLLDHVALARGLVLRGGRPDLERALQMVLGDLRNGRLGRISFEVPEP